MYGETLEAAARRELDEETGVSVDALEFVDMFSEPSRDPRLHVVSAAFCAVMDASPSAGGDARQAKWVPLTELPTIFAFDHRQILQAALRKMGHGPSSSSPVAPAR